jgi:hypothetical protein
VIGNIFRLRCCTLSGCVCRAFNRRGLILGHIYGNAPLKTS